MLWTKAGDGSRARMPLQQISVSPLEWGKDTGTRNQDWRVQEPVYTPSTPIRKVERCGSQASTISTNHDICRICHCEGDSEVPLIAPCYCAGSLRYVHQACLQQWIKSSDIRSCELCKFQFVMHSKIKPFSEWEKLDMSSVERRKLLCNVTFHAVALTCVVWSLYVLIDRTGTEIEQGVLEWPFWTKLIVVAIGFTGGLVFMYIQCKTYVQLCRRWKAYNRVIFVQNAPEKLLVAAREAVAANIIAAQYHPPPPNPPRNDLNGRNTKSEECCTEEEDLNPLSGRRCKTNHSLVSQDEDVEMSADVNACNNTTVLLAEVSETSSLLGEAKRDSSNSVTTCGNAAEIHQPSVGSDSSECVPVGSPECLSVADICCEGDPLTNLTRGQSVCSLPCAAKTSGVHAMLWNPSGTAVPPRWPREGNPVESQSPTQPMLDNMGASVNGSRSPLLSQSCGLNVA